jgi:hypothetical protein
MQKILLSVGLDGAYAITPMLPVSIQEGAHRKTIAGAVGHSLHFRLPRAGPKIAITRGMSLEIALGRWMACAVHPAAAWRKSRARERALLVATYVGAGYVATLIALVTVR